MSQRNTTKHNSNDSGHRGGGENQIPQAKRPKYC